MGCVTNGNAGGRPPLWFTALAVILTGILARRLKINMETEDLKLSKHFIRPRADADMPENIPSLESLDAWGDVGFESPTAPHRGPLRGAEVIE